MATCSEQLVIKNYIIDLNKALKGGTFGQVFRGRMKTSGTEMAFKKLVFRSSTDSTVNSFIKDMSIDETENMVKLQGNEHILSLIDFFENNGSFWLVMEYCELGDLEDYLSSFKSELDLGFKLDLMKQCSSGVCYLHGLEEYIVHRDIKLKNYVVKRVNGKDIVKLADFGITKIVEKKQGEDMLNTMYLTTLCGTAMYMAPEFFQQYVKYTCSVDIFALGLVLKVILEYGPEHKVLTPLYKDKNRPFGQELLYTHMKNLDEPTIVDITKNDNEIVKGIKATILKMTCFDSKKRCQIFEVIVDLDQYITLIQEKKQPFDLIYQRVQNIDIGRNEGNDDTGYDADDDVTLRNTQIHYGSGTVTISDVNFRDSL